ncbi:MAG: DNA primase [Balneolales bacterium]
MIPDEKKEEVRDAADIVDVVSDYVKLKRSGSGFTGLCPFHNEKTPSFHVTPTMGIYKCFGCGEGGDVFNFVMKIEGIGFTEAIRQLGDRYNVLLPEENSQIVDPSHTEKEGIYHALRFAGRFFYHTLIKHDEARSARTYLVKRGYTRETIKQFGLGYSPENGNDLKTAAENASISEEYLHKAGLLKTDGNGIRSYDTFRGRLMFPIFNPSGKVIAFGGRILKASKKAPKYINSPQTEVYNKSEVLYGIHAARNEIRKDKEAILVEGYTDVITMHQSGVKNVIATSGTALTTLQMRLLIRYAETLLLIYDSDTAGQMAMTRGIDVALAEGLGIRLLKLPDGEDPDSFVKQFGKEGFLGYKKENSLDFLSFMVQAAIQTGEWDDAVTKPKVIARMLESIACIPDVVARETFLQKLSKETKIGDRKLLDQLEITMEKRKETEERAKKRAEKNEHRPTKPEEKNLSHAPRSKLELPKEIEPDRMPGYEKELVRLMLVHGETMVEYIGSLINDAHFEDKRLQGLFKDIIQRFQDGLNFSIEAYSSPGNPYYKLLNEIIMERFSLSERGNERRDKILNQDTAPFKTARGAVKLIQLQFLDNMITRYREEYDQAEGDDKIRLNKHIQTIAQNRNKLSNTPPNKAYSEAEIEIIERKQELEARKRK